MAQSVPLGYSTAPPGTKIVFNAPYDGTAVYYIKAKNTHDARVSWAADSVSGKIKIEPDEGVLDAHEHVVIAVSCDVGEGALEHLNDIEDKVHVIAGPSYDDSPSSAQHYEVVYRD